MNKINTDSQRNTSTGSLGLLVRNIQDSTRVSGKSGRIINVQ